MTEIACVFFYNLYLLLIYIYIYIYIYITNAYAHLHIYKCQIIVSREMIIEMMLEIIFSIM